MPPSQPFPAMFVEKPRRAAHEISDVTRAFFPGAAAVMDDPHPGDIRGPGYPIEAHAPVEILEVQKKLRIEAAGRFDRFPANEHERAAHGGNRRDRLIDRHPVD